MAIRYAPTITTTGKPAVAPTSSPAAMAEMQRPVPENIPAKSQASQPVKPSGRGRKPAEDPRRTVGVRLPASLIEQLDANRPGWKAEIEALLRTHFMQDRR